MSRARLQRITAVIVGGLLITVALSSPASAADITDRALVKRVQRVAATTSPGLTVRFADGLYDAASTDVYIDGIPDAVWRLSGNRLVPAPVSDSGITPFEACGYITYFHCESTVVRSGCTPTTFWLNYNPTTDNFSSPFGHTLNPPEQVSVRDEPYRRYGPRGVRAYHDGKYGFYSVNCLSG